MVFTPLKAYPNYGTLLRVPPTAIPASLAASGVWDSDLMPAGFGGVAAVVKMSHGGVLTIQRYADLEGLMPIGAAMTQAITADTVAWTGTNDGLPFVSFNVNLANNSGGEADIDFLRILTGNPI